MIFFAATALAALLPLSALAALPDCLQTDAPFDAGYGTCDTYEAGVLTLNPDTGEEDKNFEYCKDDFMVDGNNLIYPYEACAECGECNSEPTNSAHTSCPADEPSLTNKCVGSFECAYGSETCCGETHDSFVCECSGGEFYCYYTDACLHPSCEEEEVQKINDQLRNSSGPDAQFVFSKPRIRDEDGDGIWSPGERAFVSAIMTNVWEEDHMWYPGAQITADDQVFYDPIYDNNQNERTGHYWLYGMFAGDSIEVGLDFIAPPSVIPGTEVKITFEATALHCEDNGDCPSPNPLDFVVTIGQ